MKRNEHVGANRSDSAPELFMPKNLAVICRESPFGNYPKELSDFIEKTISEIDPDTAREFSKVLRPLSRKFVDSFRGGTIADEIECFINLMGEICQTNQTCFATIPVLLERLDSQRPELVGSGVLIKLSDRTFLLTAAHIVDMLNEGTLMIPGQNGFMPIVGNYAETRLPDSGDRNDDRLDMAYFWLDRECADEIDSRCCILEKGDLLMESYPSPPNYTFNGYPWRKSDIKGLDVHTPRWGFSGVEVNPSQYEALGLSQTYHIAIRFHRRRAFHTGIQRIHSAPLPHGISGGGVYAWTEESLEMSPPRLPLAGIATEYIPAQSVLIGTRLEAYVRFILRNQPEISHTVGFSQP
jgi:hypothetical protein